MDCLVPGCPRGARGHFAFHFTVDALDSIGAHGPREERYVVPSFVVVLACFAEVPMSVDPNAGVVGLESSTYVAAVMARQPSGDLDAGDAVAFNAQPDAEAGMSSLVDDLGRIFGAPEQAVRAGAAVEPIGAAATQ